MKRPSLYLFAILLLSVSTRTTTGLCANDVSFELDVQPILTATGCNSGGCHGKQRGQNGFQLSLLGFDSDFDFAAITKESRGRRVFPSAPENSLFLQKATGDIPHGGGKRIAKTSQSYQVLKKWLVQGAKRRIENETQLEKITLNLSDELLKPGQIKELKVLAHYQDGSTRDVTEVSTYQSNDPAIVSVRPTGVMTAGKLPGETAIMARYMNVIEVCHVAIPQTKQVDASVYDRLPRRNFIDELIWKKLKRLNITPSQPVGDAKFLRRVYTDIIGRLPTAAEARTFLESDDPKKRPELVDRLLARPEYGEFMANKWADLLRTNPYRVGIKTTLNYDHWIRTQFRKNVPYDQFVRELITASGSTFRKGAVTMFRDRRSPDELTTIVTQLFLGIRLECAKCHHHPFEKWSQDDFYGFAAFFGDVSRKGTGLSPPISGSEEIILNTGKVTVKHPATGKVMVAKPLFGKADVGETDSETSTTPKGFLNRFDEKTNRERLADWITSKENDFFSQVQVNRVWADLMGRGLVEPVDDLRATNPPTNSELLVALADDFRENGFDLKHLIRTICNSYAYSLDSVPNEINVSDRLNYSRHYRHRMRAETLIDSIDQITGIPSSFAAIPPGARAMEIWTHRTGSLFLDTFGRPNPNEDPPCERTKEFTMTQSLHLMNASEIHKKLTSSKSSSGRLASSNRSLEEIVDEVYLMIYSRFPGADERKFATQLLSGENSTAKTDDKDKAKDSSNMRDSAKVAELKSRIESLMWAMINTPEFSIQD